MHGKEVPRVCRLYLLMAILFLEVLSFHGNFGRKVVYGVPYRYSCPICSKSSCDMSNVWRQFDQEIASTTLPVEQQNIIVSHYHNKGSNMVIFEVDALCIL